MFRIQKAAIAVLAASALSLTGCGLIGGTAQETSKSVMDALRSDPEASLRKAVEKSGEVKSVSLVVAGTEGGEPANGKGTLSFGQPVSGELTFADTKDGPMTIRLIGKIFYFKVPAKDKADMQGKNWVKMDLAALSKFADGKEMSADASQFDEMIRELNPTTQLKQMLDAGAFKVVGEEQVGGVKTIRYGAKVPLASYLASFDATERPKLEAKMKTAGVKEIQADVWVDEKYQLRKAHTVAGSVDDLTVTFSDHGKPVTVVAPPVAETLDMAAMMKQLKDMQG